MRNFKLVARSECPRCTGCVGLPVSVCARESPGALSSQAGGGCPGPAAPRRGRRKPAKPPRHGPGAATGLAAGRRPWHHWQPEAHRHRGTHLRAPRASGCHWQRPRAPRRASSKRQAPGDRPQTAGARPVRPGPGSDGRALVALTAASKVAISTTRRVTVTVWEPAKRDPTC
jgi:hypothetical protein